MATLKSALALALFAISAFAQDSSSSSFALSSSSNGGGGGGGGGGGSSTSAVQAQTTMNLFIDAQNDEQFVASVINADSCDTTYGLVCTEGTYGSGVLSGSCNPSNTYRATYGPSSFGFYSEVSSIGTEVTVSESCSLDGKTLAVCEASISASANGHHTKTKTTVTRSGNGVHFFQVPITAGANKLKGLASCTNSGNAAAATAITDVYKVLVVPGAAALMAGAFL